MRLARFAAVTALMLGTVGLLTLRGDTDQAPQGVPLDLLPNTIAARQAVDIPIDSAALQLLGKGVFLNRVYASGAQMSDSRAIGLFIGYFPTQRTGQSIHSPQNCLPGAGWTFERSGRTKLTGADGRGYEVGDYVITDGTNRQEVLYWYRSHGRSIASDFKAKLYMLMDAIRYNRTDGALIRIITPMQPGETPDMTHARVTAFGDQVVNLLPTYIPD